MRGPNQEHPRQIFLRERNVLQKEMFRFSRVGNGSAVSKELRMKGVSKRLILMFLLATSIANSISARSSLRFLLEEEQSTDTELALPPDKHTSLDLPNFAYEQLSTYREANINETAVVIESTGLALGVNRWYCWLTFIPCTKARASVVATIAVSGAQYH